MYLLVFDNTYASWRAKEELVPSEKKKKVKKV